MAEVNVLRKMWMSVGDEASPGLAISREYALDHGLEGPEKYPSWPKYPDERDIPVGVEARRRWKEREARISKILDSSELGQLSKKPDQSRNNPATSADNLTTLEENPAIPEITRPLCRVCNEKPVHVPERGPKSEFCSRKCRRAKS